MKQNVTCIICPRGCSLSVDGSVVTGNACRRGERYGREETTNPTRTVTSILRVNNRLDTMVSVKTSCPIPKQQIPLLMEALHSVSVSAPITLGDILLSGLYGADILATKTVR